MSTSTLEHSTDNLEIFDSSERLHQPRLIDTWEEGPFIGNAVVPYHDAVLHRWSGLNPATLPRLLSSDVAHKL